MVPHFVLTPKCDPQLTITVPAENMERIGLRDIISAEEADRLLEIITGAEETTRWEPDSKRRQKAFEAVMKGADPVELAKMIRELLTQESSNTLGRFDKSLLPQAEKRLLSEIALAKGESYEELLDFVNQAYQS